jgi:rare lipoprotein A
MLAVPVLALAHAGAPPSSTPAHVSSSGQIALVTASSEVDGGGAVDNRASRTDANLAPATTAAPTTTTTATARVRPSTTVPRTPRTTTAARRTTPTTRPAAKATPAAAKPTSSSSPAPAPSGNSQTGGGTWYDAAPPGTCAHQTLPKGTVVHITDLDTGATATCTVEDRGPYASGMILDMAKDVFSQMAPLSQGVIQIRITW